MARLEGGVDAAGDARRASRDGAALGYGNVAGGGGQRPSHRQRSAAGGGRRGPRRAAPVMYHPRMQIGLSVRHVLAVATVIAVASPVSAQLLNKEAPIVVGHFHMNA